MKKEIFGHRRESPIFSWRRYLYELSVPSRTCGDEDEAACCGARIEHASREKSARYSPHEIDVREGA